MICPSVDVLALQIERNEESRDVHLSHFRIFLRIEFQKLRMMFCESNAILPKNRGSFAFLPKKFRVTSFPVVSQKD